MNWFSSFIAAFAIVLIMFTAAFAVATWFPLGYWTIIFIVAVLQLTTRLHKRERGENEGSIRKHWFS